jgi:hypothetical protein
LAPINAPDAWLDARIAEFRGAGPGRDWDNAIARVEPTDSGQAR